jgi:peptide/nickel transport system substrate-binding protein
MLVHNQERPDSPTPTILSTPLHRRALLRIAGGVVLASGGSALLAACSSEKSDNGGSDSNPTTAPGGGGAAPTTSGGASGSPEATSATGETASPAPEQGGTITIGVDQEPPTMDPHASPSAITFYITASNGESLLYLDSDRQLQPWLAEKWEISEDAKSFTFDLASGVTFQDDTPFNAAAVKWNFDRIVDPNYKAGSALASLTGYQGTETPDDSTVVVTFSDPFVPFITYSAGSPLSFISPTATPAQGDDVNYKPVSSGPYKITEYTPKQQVVIEKWDGYTRKAPWSDTEGPGYLDKIIWKFIPESGTRSATVQSGETQVATVIPSQDLPRFQSSSDYSVVTTPWTGAPQIWLLTVDHPPTDDLAVRQAINYAVDKDAIVNTIYKGTGNHAYAPMTMVMLDDPALRAYYPFDLDKAKKTLDDAGWTAGSDGTREKDGKKLQIVLNAIDYGGGPAQIVQLIQGQLLEAGIDMQIKAQARPPWYEDNYNGATNGPVMFLRSGDLDGLYALFHSSNIGGNFNWSRLNDPDVDKMLEQGREEADPAKRKALYLDLEKKLLDLAVSVPLIDELSVWVLRSEVSGLIFNGYTYPIVANMSVKKS